MPASNCTCLRRIAQSSLLCSPSYEWMRHLEELPQYQHFPSFSTSINFTVPFCWKSSRKSPFALRVGASCTVDSFCASSLGALLMSLRPSNDGCYSVGVVRVSAAVPCSTAFSVRWVFTVSTCFTPMGAAMAIANEAAISPRIGFRILFCWIRLM